MIIKLTEIRMQSEVKQETLARALGVSQSTISQIEHGTQIPSVYLALRMAQYFRCRVEDIFSLDPGERAELRGRGNN